VAYLLNLWDYLQPEQLSYILMNLIGAGLACVSSVMINYVPFIILEGVWTASSLIALLRYVGRRMK
jgi:hypothetical protein